MQYYDPRHKKSLKASSFNEKYLDSIWRPDFLSHSETEVTILIFSKVK